MPELKSTPRTSRYGGAPEASLRGLFQALRRNRWLVLAITGSVVALVAVYTAMVTRMYETEAILRITTKDAGRGMAELGGLGLPGMGQDELETELGILRSRRIAEAVVDSLDMHVKLLVPREPRDSVIRVLRAGPDAMDGVYTLRLREDGGYTLRAEKPRRAIRIPPRVEIGQPFQVGNVTLALAPSLRKAAPDKIRFVVQPFQQSVGEVRGGLFVYRREGKLIGVRFRSSDPQLAAAVANEVAQSFVDYKVGTAGSAVAFLTEQTASYARQLQEAGARLSGYREQERVVSPGEEATQQVRGVAALRAERERLQTERESLARILAGANQAVRQGGTTSAYRQIATFPSFIANPTAQGMLQGLTGLEQRRSELLAYRTPGAEEVRQINQQIGELELQLYRFGNNYLRSLGSQIASTNQALARSGRELEQVPGRDTRFGQLALGQDLLKETFVRLHQRLTEAEIQNATEREDTRVIDPALVPGAPVSPRPMVNLVLASVLGLMMGLAAALGREMLDTKVRSASDTESATDGMPVLGTIPRIHVALGTANGSRLASGSNKLRRLAPSPETLLAQRLVTRQDPRNAASEAYRALRTNITFASDEGAPQVLVVTSAGPGDGKSTSSANLAITLAQQGRRTLLVDADLRDGLLHRVFGVRQDPGFTDLLLERTSLDEAVQQVDVGDIGVPLHFLPSGTFSPNPAELLGSDHIRQLMAELRKRYEVVVFDAPSLNLVTDAAVLGRAADATLLIARMGATEKEALQHATAQLRHLRVPVSGVVLNDFSGAYSGELHGGDGRDGKSS